MVTIEAHDVLAGRRVLIVEDEYLIATELAALLARNGAAVIGPAPDIAQARRLVAEFGPPDVAMLDVNLGGKAVWPLAESLLDAGVSVILATGYDASAIPQRFERLPRCEKPVSAEALVQTVRTAALCRGRGP